MLSFQSLLPYPGRLLGIDYGTKRIGIAVSDAQQTTALPKVILAPGSFPDFIHVLHEVGAVGCVVGMPQTLDGGSQKIAAKVRAFVDEWMGSLKIPVFLMDERMTSKQAHQALPRVENIDDVAATIILQGYLDFARNARQKK